MLRGLPLLATPFLPYGRKEASHVKREGGRDLGELTWGKPIYLRLGCVASPRILPTSTTSHPEHKSIESALNNSISSQFFIPVLIKEAVVRSCHRPCSTSQMSSSLTSSASSTPTPALSAASTATRQRFRGPSIPERTHPSRMRPSCAASGGAP